MQPMVAMHIHNAAPHGDIDGWLGILNKRLSERHLVPKKTDWPQDNCLAEKIYICTENTQLTSTYTIVSHIVISYYPYAGESKK